MPVVAKVQNDKSRVGLLSTTEDFVTKISTSGGEIHISQRSVNLASSLIPGYREMILQVNSEKENRGREIEERNVAVKKCDTYNRHFFSALKNRVSREELPLSILSLYGLPTSGIIPHARTASDIVEITKSLISADAEAVVKGYEAMANPSAAQLEAVLQEAEKEMNDAVDSDSKVNSKESQLADIRDEADELISEIIAELRFNLRREEEVDQRRIMRSYGVKFKDDVSAE